MSILSDNLEVLREWNGDFGSGSNVEWTCYEVLVSGATFAALRDQPLRLTASYVESKNPGYEVVEWIGKDQVDAGIKTSHGWLLRHKGVRGCDSCTKLGLYKLTIGPYCCRAIDKACGGPDWKCWESRVEPKTCINCAWNKPADCSGFSCERPDDAPCAEKSFWQAKT